MYKAELAAVFALLGSLNRICWAHDWYFRFSVQC